MKFTKLLLNALSGWIGGLMMTLAFSWLWQQVFPVEDRTGVGPGLPIVLSIILLIITPIAIAGGIIGGRQSKEGGTWHQVLFAALFGALFVIPFGCFLFWYLGW